VRRAIAGRKQNLGRFPCSRACSTESHSSPFQALACTDVRERQRCDDHHSGFGFTTRSIVIVVSRSGRNLRSTRSGHPIAGFSIRMYSITAPYPTGNSFKGFSQGWKNHTPIFHRDLVEIGQSEAVVV
jgi:hypothetical protein